MLVILGTKRATACTVDTKETDSCVCITKEVFILEVGMVSLGPKEVSTLRLVFTSDRVGVRVGVIIRSVELMI